MAAEIENDYLFHNDNELTRLALQHVIIKDATKGKQVFAPIKFYGPSVQILDPWPADWNAQFDLVHQRLALVVPGNEENTLKVLREYINLLKPGGWIQLVEVRQWTKETDGQAFKDMNVCLADMIQSIGASLRHIDKAKDWLQTLGLVHVQEETVEANYGTREDKKVQEIAKRSILSTAGSILGITSTFPQQMLSLPQERVLQIKDELEKEFHTEPVSAHWQYKIVWGRKPEWGVMFPLFARRITDANCIPMPGRVARGSVSR